MCKKEEEREGKRAATAESRLDGQTYNMDYKLPRDEYLRNNIVAFLYVSNILRNLRSGIPDRAMKTPNQETSGTNRSHQPDIVKDSSALRRMQSFTCFPYILSSSIP